MQSLEITEKRRDKTIIKTIVHVNPDASDSDCAAAAIALNSLSNNTLKRVERIKRNDLLGGD